MTSMIAVPVILLSLAHSTRPYRLAASACLPPDETTIVFYVSTHNDGAELVSMKLYNP